MAEQRRDYSTECCVCFEDLYNGTPVGALHCGHIYHIECAPPLRRVHWAALGGRRCYLCQQRSFKGFDDDGLIRLYLPHPEACQRLHADEVPQPEPCRRRHVDEMQGDDGDDGNNNAAAQTSAQEEVRDTIVVAVPRDSDNNLAPNELALRDPYYLPRPPTIWKRWRRPRTAPSPADPPAPQQQQQREQPGARARAAFVLPPGAVQIVIPDAD